MKRVGLLFLFVFLISVESCDFGDTPPELRSTVDIGSHLYIEVYEISGGGALTSYIVADYLTDSLNFRKFIGQLDEAKEYYSYQFDTLSRKIIIEKNERQADDKVKVIETFYLRLDSLQALKKFEFPE